MPTFVVELYLSRSDPAAVERSAERARRAAEELTLRGEPVRCLGSLFVPDDELCLLLFEAPSATGVEEAARRAGLPDDRVSAAVAADGTARVSTMGKEQR